MDDDQGKGPDLGDVVGKIQEFQQHLQQTQDRLGLETVEAEAGGGMVQVVANGRRELVSVALEPEVVDPEDIPMLQDLIVAAVNAALVKADRLAQEKVQNELSSMTGGMMPGLFGQ